MKISTSIDILASPNSIFPWIAQPDKAMLWQKDVKGGEIITETPEKTGTTFREEIEQDGKRLTMQGEIIKYIQDKQISFHLESKIHSFDVNYLISGKAEKSIFSIDLDIKWKFPMNIIFLLSGNRIKEGILKQTKLELAELKRLCENK